MSVHPEDTGSSFPDGSLGSKKAQKRKLSGKPEEKIPCKVNLQCLTTSHQHIFLKAIRTSSDSDKGHGRDFPPPKEKPDVPEVDIILNRTGQQNLTLSQIGGSSKLCITEI